MFWSGIVVFSLKTNHSRYAFGDKKQAECFPVHFASMHKHTALTQPAKGCLTCRDAYATLRDDSHSADKCQHYSRTPNHAALDSASLSALSTAPFSQRRRHPCTDFLFANT